ncbi:uncharacterized protein LOC126778589 isoform X1 [Nymphalis io]|uniref:uncharacterized protein LOC126778589 isoform X1 n=1 Tax=Inachis io TaxID=171585 RepID=UPI002168D3C9|nr:uncharacterized protein LOC126778589 isoform X1 [Nymphalis io]
MKIIFIFVILLIYKVSTQNNGILSRYKRESAGALNIVTNHAPAIHADVKDDNTGQADKPCPKTYVGNFPSNIEPGVVFQTQDKQTCSCTQMSTLRGNRTRNLQRERQVSNHANRLVKVTPPKDTLYDGKSLRKSLPLTTKLDLVRAVSRVVTLITLLFSAIVEFYPFVQHMYKTIDEFISFNQY